MAEVFNPESIDWQVDSVSKIRIKYERGSLSFSENDLNQIRTKSSYPELDKIILTMLGELRKSVSKVYLTYEDGAVSEMAISGTEA